jgi:hypothetical protein
LTKEQWNERARDAGLGTSRKADLHDLRTALLHKRLVYETSQGREVVTTGYVLTGSYRTPYRNVTP